MRRRQWREPKPPPPKPPSYVVVEGPVPLRPNWKRVRGWGWNEREQTNTCELFESPTGGYYLAEAHFLGWRFFPVLLETL